MNTVILTEYRRGRKAAIIERVSGEFADEYRVTVAERFHALPKAQEAFLAATPPSMKDTLTQQIEDANNSILLN